MRLQFTRASLAAVLAMLAATTAACTGTRNPPILSFDALDSSADPGVTGDEGTPGDSGIENPFFPPKDLLQRDDLGGIADSDPSDPGTLPDDLGGTPDLLPSDPGSPPTDLGADAPQCKDSSTCAMGRICVLGQCVQGCTSDRDCPDKRHCKPDALPHGFCAVCLLDTHCDTLAREKCVSGTCVATCQGNDDCKDREAAPYCDSTSETCVQCLTDDACPIGSLCIASRCKTGCRSDRDCPESRKKCDAKDGSNGDCYPCVRDPDCDGRVCRDHQCVVDCSAVNCPAERPKCEPSSGDCVRCLQKADCPAGNLCLGSSCVAGCEGDGDCDGGRKCSNGTCVQCVSDDACPPTQKCLQNQCLSAQCMKDTDCGVGRYCHPLLRSCETLPPKYCVDNADCASIIPFVSEACDALTRTCIPACADIGGYGLCLDLLGQTQRTVCVDGGCYLCGTDSDCPGTRCDPFDRSCEVCEGDADCAVPTWHCDSGSGTCMECLDDGQCPSPKVCDEAGGNRCVDCLRDDDCKDPGRPVCSKSKACIPPCLDECTKGAKACNTFDTTEPIGFLTCGDYDDDPCLEYGNAAECGTGSSCRSQPNGQGQCICQDECTSGQKRCVADAPDSYELCAQANGSGCWYWTTANCDHGELCSEGICACGNLCQIGTKACSAKYADQVLVCDDYDPYNVYADCPYWQVQTTCPSGYVCKEAGTCAKP